MGEGLVGTHFDERLGVGAPGAEEASDPCRIGG